MKYRMLNAGETIQQGDELRLSTGEWSQAIITIPCKVDESWHGVGNYRRPVRERCRHENREPLSFAGEWCKDCGALYVNEKWHRCKRDKDGGR